MNDALIANGHDSRFITFSQTGNTVGNSGHKEPLNSYHWIVGCLGIRPQCSGQCEASFLQQTNCVGATSDPGLPNFDNCLTAAAGCAAHCAPTLAMLKHSEKPKSIALNKGNFGYQAAINGVFAPTSVPTVAPTDAPTTQTDAPTAGGASDSSSAVGAGGGGSKDEGSNMALVAGAGAGAVVALGGALLLYRRLGNTGTTRPGARPRDKTQEEVDNQFSVSAGNPEEAQTGVV